jgi:glucose-1-phosphate adenylyltransferase
MIEGNNRVFTFPFTGYWVDVGTVSSYWQAHMDLLDSPPSIDLNDRSWIIHTRTEERPPVWISNNTQVVESMITDGCTIGKGAIIERSVLGPGVKIGAGAVVRESIIHTDAFIEAGAVVQRAIIDKKVCIKENAQVGKIIPEADPAISMVGKNSLIPSGLIVEPGAIIATDVIESDYISDLIRSEDYVQTKRKPYEV